MTGRRTRLALGITLVVAPLVWAAVAHYRRAEAADELLRAAATAHRHVSYAGQIAMAQDRWGPPVSVRHDAATGRTSYRWGFGFRSVHTEPRARAGDPSAWCLDLDALLENYDARELDPIDLLGRRARVLEVVPRHAGRPSVELAIDAATSLPLKVVTYNPDGTLYRKVGYTELHIGPQDVSEAKGPGSFRGRDDGPMRPPGWFGTAVPLDRLREHLDFDVLVPDYVPAGFRLLECRVLESYEAAARVVYTDGVTAFELTQTLVKPFAQLEHELSWMTPERRRATLDWIQSQRIDRLVEREPAGDGAANVYRRVRGYHRTYELRIGDLEVELATRADIDPEEIVRVLRSLRPR